jgi:predicted small lipoprotein YifL
MRRRATLAVIGAVVAALAACGEDRPSAAPAAAAAPAAHEMDQSMDHAMRDKDRAAAMLATAGFQDVATAEAAGYTSSLDTLGCFQDPARGGMGVHYINQSLLDANLDITKPEALVYELDAAGHITGLVAHEYIVPVDAWTSKKPPRLFGMDLHRHPTLPLWVLHTWLWKDNPTGVFQDWNPAVRLCPAGVPIFGQDLPAPAPPPTVDAASSDAPHSLFGPR